MSLKYTEAKVHFSFLVNTITDILSKRLEYRELEYSGLVRTNMKASMQYLCIQLGEYLKSIGDGMKDEIRQNTTRRFWELAMCYWKYADALIQEDRQIKNGYIRCAIELLGEIKE